MIQKRIFFTAHEIDERLASVDDAFRIADEDRLHFGAHADQELCGQDVLSQLDKSFLGVSLLNTSLPALPRGLREGISWVLILPYEAFREDERLSADPRPPALIQDMIARHYPATITVTSEGAFLFAETEEAGKKLETTLGAPLKSPPKRASLQFLEVEPPEAHLRRIRLALAKVQAGQLYQVNLARRFLFQTQGTALQILQSLGRSASAPFSSAFNANSTGIISTSPELFLDLQPDGKISTRPIKGTRPRASDENQDALNRAELDADEKERAELAMVIDIERNDLGKLSEIGSVIMSRAPHIETYPTVHHREAEVQAQLRNNITLSEVLKAMMPSGSVTGAPKLAAMECIAQTEAHRRGLYTGALGYLSNSGRLRLSMAIRTLTFKDGLGHYFAGGGIVADSQPEMEVQETLWKAAQLGNNPQIIRK